MNHALIFSVRCENYERGAGAHRIATFLRRHDWDIEVVDFSAFWEPEELKEFVRSRVTADTKFIGFSTFFNYWPEHMNTFVSWIKTQHPTVPTICGGQSVALINAKGIDYWIDSYGEQAILAVVRKIIGVDTTPIKYDFQHLNKGKFISALHSYPAYPMDSYATLLEPRDYVEPYEWLTTEFSRGCRFKCDFCNFPILGVKGDYSRTSEDFELEMRHNYDNFGVKHYYVADDTFNDRVDKIVKFADVAKNLDFKPYFSGFIRADLAIVKPESWEHLVRLNFGAQYYGIESLNHNSRKVISKGMDPDKIKKGLLDMKAYFSPKMDYRGTVSLIVGLPFETKASWKSTTDWLLTNWTEENTIVFPLDIPVGNAKPSEFSKKMFKYNLREMSPDDLKKNYPSWYNKQLGNFHQDNQMIWEHDTMDLPTAHSLVTEFEQHHNKFKCSSFDLHLGFLEDYNLDVLGSKSKLKTYSLTHKYRTKFLKTYINRKLNHKT